MLAKFLLADIDGTVLGYKNDKERYDPLLPIKFNNLIGIGFNVGLVSGRPYEFCTELYSELRLNGPIIAEMGGLLDIGQGKTEIVGGFDERLKKQIESFMSVHEATKKIGMELEKGKLSMVSFAPQNHNPKAVSDYFSGIQLDVKTRFPNVKITYDDFSVDVYDSQINKGVTLERMHALIKDEKEYNAAGDSLTDNPLFSFVHSHGGVNCYVGRDASEKTLAELREIDPKIIITKRKNSNGLVDFINYLLYVNR